MHQVVYRLARWLAALVGVLAQDPAHRPASAQPSSRASVASSEHAPSARPSNAAASVASASTKASSTYIISERGAVPLKPAAPPFRRFSSPGAPVALQVPTPQARRASSVLPRLSYATASDSPTHATAAARDRSAAAARDAAAAAAAQKLHSRLRTLHEARTRLSELSSAQLSQFSAVATPSPQDAIVAAAVSAHVVWAQRDYVSDLPSHPLPLQLCVSLHEQPSWSSASKLLATAHIVDRLVAVKPDSLSVRRLSSGCARWYPCLTRHAHAPTDTGCGRR